MKLKRLAEDFQVEEQVSLAPSGGPLAMYLLTKESLGTLEAIEAIRRRWKLDRGRIAFAGLKDKHAQTRQFVTIEGGPPRNLSEESFRLEYLGPAARPIHASDILSNAFTVVIRELSEAEAQAASAALSAATQFGVPNYFDDQRFGSLGESGHFIAEPWCRGDYERTLWLALAEPNARDRPEDREQKRLLRDHWGQWQRCGELLARSERQRVAGFLESSRGDFRRAIGLLRQDLRSLWLAAYQSQLWNQVLAALLREVCRPEQLAPQTIGRRELPMFDALESEQFERLRATQLPLPSARLHLERGPLQELYDRVLAAEGIALRELRVKYPRDSFFSKGERAVLLLPQAVEQSAAADELYPGRRKLTLRFSLARGSYATILIKRVTGSMVEWEGDDVV